MKNIAIQQGTQSGATLIEVLIAVLVLSIGLLGIAGLQAATVRYKINTWSRIAVSDLVADIADRIRANPNAAGTSFGEVTAIPSSYTLSSSWSSQQAATLSLPSPNCNSATCTADQRAAFDMVEWRMKVREKIPQGAALMSGTKLSGVNITFMWFDKNYTDKGKASDSALLTSSTCDGTENGAARQTCCPSQASAPAGVRCISFQVIP